MVAGFEFLLETVQIPKFYVNARNKHNASKPEYSDKNSPYIMIVKVDFNCHVTFTCVWMCIRLALHPQILKLRKEKVQKYSTFYVYASRSYAASYFVYVRKANSVSTSIRT